MKKKARKLYTQSIIVYVDIGQLPTSKALKFLDYLKGEFKDLTTNLPNDTAILWFPIRAGGSGSRIEVASWK